VTRPQQASRASVSLFQIKVIPLKKVTTDRGHLMEVERRDDSFYLDFGQAYITMTKPGVVRAWYRHKRQTDQIALVKGRLLLVLIDSREDSPTFQAVQQIRITEDAPALVQIPPGIWHGFQALDGEAYLLHLNTVPFEFGDPDEERLAADDPRIPYRWASDSA
jgi:dTDP-4-dehydrorhamnose 3,5-epimerase